MKKNTLTQYDIARSLNVSQATVARVINNEPNVSEETRKKVLDKIKELNYTPNILARNLAKKSNKKIKLKILLPKYLEEFWKQIHDGINAGLKEIENISIAYEISHFKSVDGLLKCLNDIYNDEQIDYLVLFPLNNNTVIDKINQIRDKGIGIVFINDNIQEVESLFYIGPDNISSGKIAGEFMGKFLQGKGNVFVIASFADQSETKERITGFSEILRKDFSNIKLNCFYYDFEKEDAYTFTKELLERYDNVDGIYNPEGFIDNVAKAIKDSGKNVVFIGHEYFSESKELLEDNTITLAISQDAFNQGYFCMKILYNYLTKKIELNGNKFYVDYNIIMKNTKTRNNEFAIFK